MTNSIPIIGTERDPQKDDPDMESRLETDDLPLQRRVELLEHVLRGGISHRVEIIIERDDVAGCEVGDLHAHVVGGEAGVEREEDHVGRYGEAAEVLGRVYRPGYDDAL